MDHLYIFYVPLAPRRVLSLQCILSICQLIEIAYVFKKYSFGCHQGSIPMDFKHCSILKKVP